MLFYVPTTVRRSKVYTHNKSILRRVRFRRAARPSGSAEIGARIERNWHVPDASERAVYAILPIHPVRLWFFCMFWVGEHYMSREVRESRGVRRV